MSMQKAQQIEKCPFTEDGQQESGQGEIGLLEQCLQRTATADGRYTDHTVASGSPTREDLDMPRFVGCLHSQQLHYFAKMRVHASEQSCRDQQCGLFVLDE